MRDIAQEIRNTVILMKAAGWSEVTFYGRSMEGESSACEFTHNVPGFGRVPNLYEKPNWHLAWEIITRVVNNEGEKWRDFCDWWEVSVEPGDHDGVKTWLNKLTRIIHVISSDLSRRISGSREI